MRTCTLVARTGWNLFEWITTLWPGLLFRVMFSMSCHFQTLGKKTKQKPFRLPQSESKRKMENLHILFLCLCTVPCRFLRWLSLFLFFQPIIRRPFLLSVSLNDHPERKKTLWYSYRNQSNVIFESHPSRDRADWNKTVPHESVWSRFHLPSALRDG